MAEAVASIDLPVAPDKVWALIGGFGSLPDWLPYIPRSDLQEGGRVRRLVNPEGATIVERLIAFDHPGRSYSYAILQAPFPVTDYLSTLTVEAAEGGGARVVWSGRFTPLGAGEEEVSALFRGIYEEGLTALAERLASQG